MIQQFHSGNIHMQIKPSCCIHTLHSEIKKNYNIRVTLFIEHTCKRRKGYEESLHRKGIIYAVSWRMWSLPGT